LVNVAIFTDNDFDKVNGVTTTLRAVLQHAPLGLLVRVYTASARGVNEPQYLALRSLRARIPFYREMRMYFPRVGRYRRQAIADRIDVVHLTTPGPIGLAAMRVARQLELPLVGSFHTDLEAYTRILSGSPRLGALMREFMRWPYGRCARVLVPSEATRQLLAGAGSDERRIQVWRRGVDSAWFDPARRSDRLRQAWGVSAERPALLYVGRLSREKGLDLLPSLHDRLKQRGVAHRFVVAGRGPMRDELRHRMPDAIFTGQLARDEVAAAFASADAFVFPSRTDTAGNVVLEAQASGLPVFVSDTGGPRENMIDGRTGVIVAGAAAAAWADSLAAVLHDRGRMSELASAAREYGVARRWENALEPLYRTYYEVLRAPVPLSVTGRLLPRRAPLL
jgi:glycosyltransferase involved in cell wall biosynthesis